MAQAHGNGAAQIEALARKWADAERRGDTDFLARHLTDDFVAVGPLGFLLPKQDWLTRHMPGNMTYDTFQFAEVQVRIYGTAAVMVAHQTANGAYRGQVVPSDLRVSAVFVEQAGEWRIAGIQMSFIAGTPGAPPLPGRP